MADREPGGAPDITCVVVTPEATVLETTASFLALPLFDGEIGIGRNRAALIGRLGFGELRVVRPDETLRFYLDGGFVQVTDNRVSILTGQAIDADQLDPPVLQEQLAAARGRVAHGAEQMAARDRAVARVRAQVHVARAATRL